MKYSYLGQHAKPICSYKCFHALSTDFPLKRRSKRETQQLFSHMYTYYNPRKQCVSFANFKLFAYATLVLAYVPNAACRKTYSLIMPQHFTNKYSAFSRNQS